MGALDAQLAATLIAAIGGVMAALSLALRYWFPPAPRNHRPPEN